jgi:hypothetical protein
LLALEVSRISFQCLTGCWTLANINEDISQIRLFEDLREELQEEYLDESECKPHFFEIMIHDWHIDKHLGESPEQFEDMNINDCSDWKVPRIRFVEIRKANSGR